jgi:hypothetical protein
VPRRKEPLVAPNFTASLRTDFVLDALEQAIYDRCGNDRGTQYLSMVLK